MGNSPTDAELWQLYMQQPGQHKDPIGFARAALAKWGTPATVEVEPVAWAATSEDGDVEALGMNQSRRFDTPLYTTPQPTHAQAGAVTDAQVLAAVRVVSPNLFRHGLQPLPHDGANTAAQMRKEADTVRKMLEAANGIKGKTK